LEKPAWLLLEQTALKSDKSHSGWSAGRVEAGKPYALLVKTFIDY
jgi:hypothetical protein